MYRGDDIYLLNWWPLDNQNTMGGGVAKAWGGTSLALHAGMQRLDLPNQFQQVPSPVPYTLGAINVTTLDRPRTVETAKITHLVRGLSGPDASDGLKLALYGEAHQMAAGVRRDVALGSQIPLPQDDGWLIGSQVVYFTGLRNTYAAFFFRHARGLAVYDPLSSPVTFANNKTTKGAHETLFAMSGNFEDGPFGILWGSYLRFVRGATEAATSLDRYDEGILVVQAAMVRDRSHRHRRGGQLPGAALRPARRGDRRPARRVDVSGRRTPLLLAGGTRIVCTTAHWPCLRCVDAQRRRAHALPARRPFFVAIHRALLRASPSSGGSTCPRTPDRSALSGWRPRPGAIGRTARYGHNSVPSRQLRSEARCGAFSPDCSA